MDNSKTNVLYISNLIESSYPNVFSLVEENFNIVKISTFKDLKVNFNNFQIIFLNISNQNDLYFINILKYIKENKHDQKILATIDKKDTWLLLECITNKVNDFIFMPFDDGFNEKVRFKFEEFDRELNFMSKIYNIKSLDLRSLKKELNYFYQNDISKINEHFAEYESVLKIILNTEKYSEFRDDLLDYFSSFIIQDRQERLNYINNFALEMLYRSNNDRIEDNMIRPVIEDLIVEFKEIYGKVQWSANFLDLIKMFFEIEIKIMGLNLKYEIQKRLKDKERELHSNSLHFLMSSSSDKLNNYANIIDGKLYAVDRLMKMYDDENVDEVKLKKGINGVKAKGDPLDEFQKFLKNQSKLFTKFKDEITKKSSLTDLVFLINFAYVNGMKVKYNNIKVNFIIDFKDEELDHIFINSNENIILGSMYGIIENALESGCENIKINLFKKFNDICIGISNDGEKITKEVEKRLFDKFFSTKQQYGLGLYTIKEWLTNISYKIEYISQQRSFLISIPISEEN